MGTLNDTTVIEKMNELLLVLLDIQRQQNMIGAHLSKLVTLAEKKGERWLNCHTRHACCSSACGRLPIERGALKTARSRSRWKSSLLTIWIVTSC